MIPAGAAFVVRPAMVAQSCGGGGAITSRLPLDCSVITSYSIHYTKLYDICSVQIATTTMKNLFCKLRFGMLDAALYSSARTAGAICFLVKQVVETKSIDHRA